MTLASGVARLKGRGTAEVSQVDVNQDGLVDLVVGVVIESQRRSGDQVEVFVTGVTTDGVSFSGADTVVLRD